MNFNFIPRFTFFFRLNDFFKVVFYCFIKSKYSLKLKNEIKEELDVENIFFVNHARTGLKIFLRAIGKGNKLRVGVQTYNCETVFNAIISSGHIPVFLDINSNFTLDTNKLKKVRNDIDVLIVTYTFGIPIDFNEIKNIIGEKIIIEDCAHALFSEINKKQVGNFGEASIFSFGYGKYPSIGKGGYLVLNNKSLLADVTKQFESLEKPGFKEELFNLFKVLVYATLHIKLFYKHFTFPLKKKFGNSVDITNKKDITESKGLCSNVVRFILTILNKKQLIKKQFVVGEKINSLIKKQYISTSIRLESKTNYFCIPLLSSNQKDFIEFLNSNGIEASAHFSNSIKIAQAYGYINNSCPFTEDIVNKIVTVPCHYYLNNKDIQHIITSVNSYKL